MHIHGKSWQQDLGCYHRTPFTLTKDPFCSQEA